MRSPRGDTGKAGETRGTRAGLERTDNKEDQEPVSSLAGKIECHEINGKHGMYPKMSPGWAPWVQGCLRLLGPARMKRQPQMLSLQRMLLLILFLLGVGSRKLLGRTALHLTEMNIWLTLRWEVPVSSEGFVVTFNPSPRAHLTGENCDKVLLPPYSLC